MDETLHKLRIMSNKILSKQLAQKTKNTFITQQIVINEVFA